jgi:predicted ATPase
MYLTHLHIQHFRSLYSVQLDLKPLTIFIGPNASGKSNLFKALRFLHDAVAGDRLEWQAYDSQIDDLLWYGVDEYGNRPENLTFACEFGSLDTSLARYEAVLRCNDYLNVETEELTVALASGAQLCPYFSRRGEQIRQHIGRRGSQLKQPYALQARSPRTLTLRDEGPDSRLPQARTVYDHLRGWRFFDVALQQARQEAFIPEYPEEIPPLANDAANLSAFLYALWRLRTDDFSAVVESLSDFVDLPENLQVEHNAEWGGQSARYFFVEAPFGEAHPVPPQSVSDGTVRLLAYLALLLGDSSVSLACLEEPDHGLHPRLMLYLADILRQTVTLPPEDGDVLTPQMLITTHSPDFMDCFDLEEERDYLQVYIAGRDELGRTILTPTTAEEFAPWLEKYRLGEAVRRHLV